MSQALIVSAVAVLLYMTAVFLLALRLKDNSIVDIAWGPGFVLVASLSFFWEGAPTARHLLVTGLVAVWGTRLAVHIFLRKKGRGEDFRYAEWRRSWGKRFVPRSYFQVFFLQGLLLLLVAYPIIIINLSAVSPLRIWDGLGFLVWVLGFVFEVASDAQMERFRRDPTNKGKIIGTGLWRFSRHPNYFGEATLWWGIFVIGLAVPRGWMGVLSPVLLTLLLTKVSGVPLLEKKYAGNPEFAAYARRTSVFIPWVPKRSPEARPRAISEK